MVASRTRCSLHSERIVRTRTEMQFCFPTDREFITAEVPIGKTQVLHVCRSNWRFRTLTKRDIARRPTTSRMTESTHTARHRRHLRRLPSDCRSTVTIGRYKLLLFVATKARVLPPVCALTRQPKRFIEFSTGRKASVGSDLTADEVQL